MLYHKTYENSNKLIGKHSYDHKTLMALYQQSQPLNAILEPTNNFGGLYLGNMEAAQNYSNLRRLGIKAVLTVASKSNLRYNENVIPYHEVIIIDDSPDQNLGKYFDQIYNFIDKHRQTTNVLVHCFAGISRSATSVIMYLMKKNKWSYEKAFFHCRQKRKVTNPNPGFIKQLLDFERNLADERAGKEVQRQKKKVEFQIDQKLEEIKLKDDFNNRQTLYREQLQHENKDVYDSLHNDRLQQFKLEQEQKMQRSKYNQFYDNGVNQKTSYLDPINNVSNQNVRSKNILNQKNSYLEPLQNKQNVLDTQQQQQQNQMKNDIYKRGTSESQQQSRRLNNDIQIENKYQQIKEAEIDSKLQIQQELLKKQQSVNNNNNVKNNTLYQKYQALDNQNNGNILDKYTSFRNIYTTQANSSYGRYVNQQVIAGNQNAQQNQNIKGNSERNINSNIQQQQQKNNNYFSYRY